MNECQPLIPGSGAATASDVADELAGELAARGVGSAQVLAAALTACELPIPAGGPLAAAAAAVREAAGGRAYQTLLATSSIAFQTLVSQIGRFRYIASRAER